jgi:hypothetical protein
MADPITAEHIRQFAAAWYRALDVHAPLEECWKMLADDGLTMQFPDADIHNFGLFQKWYEGVTNLYFDERHTIRKIDVHDSTDSQVHLAVRVRWQAGWWEPPAAESRHVDLEASQTWTVRRCSTIKNRFGLEIVTYTVAPDFEYAPGSAALPGPAPGNADALVRLNERIGEMEQQGGPAAREFFTRHLAHDLVFRRASGKVVGKFGPEGFIEGLENNPFKSRVIDDISVSLLGHRALVTLIVVGTRKDDGSVHRYRNVRLFSHRGGLWVLEVWYNYEIPGL